MGWGEGWVGGSGSASVCGMRVLWSGCAPQPSLRSEALPCMRTLQSASQAPLSQTVTAVLKATLRCPLRESRAACAPWATWTPSGPSAKMPARIAAKEPAPPHAQSSALLSTTQGMSAATSAPPGWCVLKTSRGTTRPRVGVGGVEAACWVPLAARVAAYTGAEEDRCAICPPSPTPNPALHAGCAFNFGGPECTSCAKGYTHPGYTLPFVHIRQTPCGICDKGYAGALNGSTCLEACKACTGAVAGGSGACPTECTTLCPSHEFDGQVECHATRHAAAATLPHHLAAGMLPRRHTLLRDVAANWGRTRSF